MNYFQNRAKTLYSFTHFNVANLLRNNCAINTILFNHNTLHLFLNTPDHAYCIFINKTFMQNTVDT